MFEANFLFGLVYCSLVLMAGHCHQADEQKDKTVSSRCPAKRFSPGNTKLSTCHVHNSGFRSLTSHALFCRHRPVLYYTTSWPMHLSSSAKGLKHLTITVKFSYISLPALPLLTGEETCCCWQSLSGDFSVLSTSMLKEKRYLGCGLIWACLAKSWISDGKAS